MAATRRGDATQVAPNAPWEPPRRARAGRGARSRPRARVRVGSGASFAPLPRQRAGDAARRRLAPPAGPHIAAPPGGAAPPCRDAHPRGGACAAAARRLPRRGAPTCCCRTARPLAQRCALTSFPPQEEALLRKYNLPADTSREILHRVLASLGESSRAPAQPHPHAAVQRPPPPPEPRSSPAPPPPARHAASPRRTPRAHSPEPRAARDSGGSARSGGASHAPAASAAHAASGAPVDVQARLDELQAQLARRTAQLRNAEVRPSAAAPNEACAAVPRRAA